ncbi:DUF397 domain-containing protein [Streptomyces sp. TRM66268-LWL]|uniref:DUF397 domain-containing protein n=1 Tax=Streptomyces polyasparticus TaxID=2767826 RepID=A0ABR7SYP8_9ACTN|nr:DUF397 domain-containing protein [Streptomyces polyasparticus]MBC9719393.1 DUF397 domain-containing protein [Streptomyces polyasparticus]
MRHEQAERLRWFKSSYSGGDGGECVEVATTPEAVHVRDSKERLGPRIVISHAAWTGFVSGLGRCDAN